MTLTRREADILVQLRWVTNLVEEWTVPLPPRGPRAAPDVVARVRELALTHTDAEIAIRLNEEGQHTAHGQAFTAQRVHTLRRVHKIMKKKPALAEVR